MTLQLLHSEFPDIWGRFSFLFCQCELHRTFTHIQSYTPSPRSTPRTSSFHRFIYTENQILIFLGPLEDDCHSYCSLPPARACILFDTGPLFRFRLQLIVSTEGEFSSLFFPWSHAGQIFSATEKNDNKALIVLHTFHIFKVKADAISMLTLPKYQSYRNTQIKNSIKFF